MSSKYSPLLSVPDNLTTLLEVADVDDLCVLADYITDNGEGRLSLDSDKNKKLTACSKHRLFVNADRLLIAEEILLFGGNSIANLYRGFLKNTAVGNFVSGALPSVSNTISYAELVEDVAKKSNSVYGEGDSVPDMENAILLRIFKQAYDKMSEAERKSILGELGISSIGALRNFGKGAVAGVATTATLSAASLNVAALVATAVSTQMLGRAAIVGGTFAGSRGLAALAGPVGIAVATLWTVADLSSPAYRVTLPCVVQIAYMRQKYMAALNSNKCPSCSAENAPKAKFCGECGMPLGSP